MPTKARYLADLLNASGELDSTGAIEAIQDQISSLFAAGTHTGISFSYDDSSGTFSATVGTEFIEDTVGAMFSSNTETNITASYEDSDGTIDLAVEQQLNNTSAPYYHKITVTVSGGKFLLDGGSQQVAKLSPTVVYRFDQSDSSNATHPLRFSTTSDGTHGGGSEISSGYTIYNKVGTPGSSGAYTEVCFEMDCMNPLYYYCSNHSNMGASVIQGTPASTTFVPEGTNQYHTTERVQDVVGGMVSSNTESGISVTYDDSDGTLDFNVNDPTISLTGDVTGSATMTDLGNTSISTTIAANSVALGTDTTGNYVQSITGTANEITVSGSGSETADVTISLPDDVTIGDDLTVTGDIGATNLTLSGNLTVQGSTTTVSSSTLAVTDGAVKVSKDNAANATDFGLYGQYVEGSTTKYAGLLWDASESNKFRLFHGNQSEPTTTVDTSGTGHATGKLIADLEGNADTATALATARTIALSGDVTGSGSFDGTGNLTISSTIAADSVVLGTDTTGNFLREISAGEGIDVSHTQGEGSTATISVEDATETNKGIATFDGTDFTVSSGDVTINAERIQDITGAMFSSNTETGIAITYDDSDGTIDATVSLSSFDTDNLSEGSSNLYYTNERVDDRVAALLQNGTGISFAYNDASGTLTPTISGTSSLITDFSEAVQDVTGGQLVTNGSHTGITASYDDSGDGAIDLALVSENVQDIVGGMFSGNTETGISASYQDDDGTIDLVVSGTSSIISDFEEAVEDVVGGMVSSNTENGISVTYDDTDGTLDFNVNDPVLTFTGDATGSGTITDLGNTSIALTIGSGAVENSMLAGSIANSKLSNSSITVSDGSASTAIALGNTLTFSGTSQEVDVSESSGTVTVGLPSNVTIGNNLTVSGNLTVTGTTTQTGSTTTDSNFQGFTSGNTGNSTDFGFYGKYVEGGTTKYGGLFFDASTDNTFRLFADTQTVPSTTVDTTATGYGVATLVANVTGNVSGSSGSTTGNAATATALATSRNFTVTGDATTDSSQSFDGTGNVALPITLANSGVSAATYGDADSVAQVAIDAKGRVTSASNVDISITSGAVSDFNEAAQDAVGAMFSGNTETGIAVTYDDSSNKVNFAVSDVTLGSGTSGNYVAGVSAGTGVSVSGSGSEGATATVSIGQAVSTTSDVTFADIAATDITASGNVVVTGNLTVNGSTVTNSATNTTIEDQLIELGTGNSGSPSGDSGIIIERGSSANAFMGWDESADSFKLGTTTATGASSGDLTITAADLVVAELSASNIDASGTITGTFSGNLTGTLQTAAQGNVTSLGTLSSLAVSGTSAFTGAATTSYTTIGASAKAMRNIFIHSSAPGGSDGAVGDIWITYS